MSEGAEENLNMISNELMEKMSMSNLDQEESEENVKRLKIEMESIYKRINEYEMNTNIRQKMRSKDLEDLKSKFQVLRHELERETNRNEKLKKEIMEKSQKINQLVVDTEDMKQVIAKLVDARIVLNKYFSVHYENFTEDEKKLIREIEGNIFPGYYNNNPILPDIYENKKNPLTNPNDPHAYTDNNNYNNNSNNNLKRSQNYYSSNNNNNYSNNNGFDNPDRSLNNKLPNINDQPKQSIKTILNESEYLQYQKNMKSGNMGHGENLGNSRAKQDNYYNNNAAYNNNNNYNNYNNYNNSQTNNNVSYSKNYYGPDDDYWYSRSKKRK